MLRRGCCSGSISIGGVNVGLRSGPRVTVHASWWINRWWKPQRATPLSRSVDPPSTQDTIWCISHHFGGRSQPGNAHPRSRSTTATRAAPVNNRRARPTSTGTPAPSRTTGRIRASHAIRRTAAADSSSPVSSVPTPVQPSTSPTATAEPEARTPAAPHRPAPCRRHRLALLQRARRSRWSRSPAAADHHRPVAHPSAMPTGTPRPKHRPAAPPASADPHHPPNPPAPEPSTATGPP
jgi:hypothetical protein